MAVTTEIARNIYRISIFAQRGNLQFSHFLVKEPLWYPTTHKKSGTVRVGGVPGHEFSGVIAAMGREPLRVR
jgi:hypothetical protein